MAIYRKIHTSFWSDPFIQELRPEEKYFFLYLLTNEKTTQCGIYEISKRQISYDTGYSIDTVSILLNLFSNKEKIKYSDRTNEVSIRNWQKYNGSESPTVQVIVNQQLESVKDKDLIEYLYSMDTTNVKNKNKNKNINKNISISSDGVLNFTFYEFWDLYDKKTGSIEKLKKKWEKLTEEERANAMEYIPKYKATTPTKIYRKNAETFLNNKSWNDELIFKINGKENHRLAASEIGKPGATIYEPL